VDGGRSLGNETSFSVSESEENQLRTNSRAIGGAISALGPSD